VKTGYQDKIIQRKSRNMLRLGSVVLTQLVGYIFNDNRAFLLMGDMPYS
jgi:hypothetical protein